MLLRRFLLTGLSLLVAGSLTLAGTESTDPWRVRLEPTATEDAEIQAESIVLQRASYKVAIVGATAMGVIVQEFVNLSEIDIVTTYRGRAPQGLVPLELELNVDGATVDDAIPAPAPEPKPQPRRRGRSRGVRPKPVDAQAQITKPFTVPAGGQVVVRSAFRIDLAFDEGLLHLRLPAVRNRIAPADAEAPEHVAVAVLGDIVVTVHHDQPLPRIESTTHDILSGFETDRTWVELSAREEESRAFEMTFALGREDEPTLTAFVGGERDGARDVTVLFTPAVEPTDEAIRARQLLLILDTSGSMAGDEKLSNAKLALASCLDRLGSTDQLNMAEFDAGFTLFSPQPVQAQQSLAAAHQWLESQQAEGATQLMPALEAVLEQPMSPEHHRMIVVLTDGKIADEKQALEMLTEKLGDGRLFVVGIGKDVQQDTILRLSEYGRGTSVFVDDPEELEAAVSGLFDSISKPLAWDLELDWGDAEVELIGTHRIPDLYAARPVTVQARVRGQLPDEVLLRVTTTEGTKTFMAVLPGSARRH